MLNSVYSFLVVRLDCIYDIKGIEIVLFIHIKLNVFDCSKDFKVMKCNFLRRAFVILCFNVLPAFEVTLLRFFLSVYWTCLNDGIVTPFNAFMLNFLFAFKSFINFCFCDRLGPSFSFGPFDSAKGVFSVDYWFDVSTDDNIRGI